MPVGPCRCFRDMDLSKSRNGRQGVARSGVGAPLEVVLFAVDEHDDVGVLFDATACP